MSNENTEGLYLPTMQRITEQYILGRILIVIPSLALIGAAPPQVSETVQCFGALVGGVVIVGFGALIVFVFGPGMDVKNK